MNSVSIVVPVMNEQDTVLALAREAAGVLGNCPDVTRFEIVFVDDGSTDATWAAIEQASAEHDHVRGLRLRRNFGKAAALQEGIHATSGDIIITMDGDLQDDPHEIPAFLSAMDSGLDLVSGWKVNRQDSFGKTAPSKLFNLVTRHVSGIALHDFNCGFKAYRRQIFDSVRLYGELHRFIPVLAGSLGYRIGEIEVRHHPRRFGKSKYGARRLIKGFLDLLSVTLMTRYGSRPGHLFGGIGLLVAGVGALINLYMACLWLMGHPIGQRPLLALGILLTTLGIQLILFGALAELMVSQYPATDRRNLVSSTTRTTDNLSSTRTGHETP